MRIFLLLTGSLQTQLSYFTLAQVLGLCLSLQALGHRQREKVPAGKAGSGSAAGARAGRETWSLPAAPQATKPYRNRESTCFDTAACPGMPPN